MAVGPDRRRRRWSLVVTFLAIVLALVGSPPAAHADPGTDDEGASSTLREKLEDAARGYYDARTQLAASEKRQAKIVKTLREAEISLVRLSAEVSQIAAGRYKAGQLGVLDGLITGEGTPSTLLQGAAVAEYLVWRDDEQLRLLHDARDEATKQQALLDAELKLQAKQLSELDKKKRAAEKALAAVGGMVTAGYSGPASRQAQPAPRTADGGWPRNTCTIKDPTGTGGCITQRMYHALIEAQLAGFTRFTRCWRTQSWGEHPKGRACDFSVSKGGFGGAATGEDKAYGNRLAAWCKYNAESLGVLYVIWYRQIWMPGIGWRAYFGYGGASGEHTNHVHLSML